MATRKGRKLKLRRTARGRRKSTSGVLPVVDVRSSKGVKDLMKRIRKGKVTIILVYADWCGHCHHFMPHFDKAANNPNRSVEAAKVNETMVAEVNEALAKNNQSASPINVEGYPSVILVDNAGKKITDVEAVKDTSVMTKVMNESGKLAENAGISAANANQSANANINDETVSTSIVPLYKRSSPTITNVNSAVTPDFIVNTSANDIDLGENEGVSATSISKNSMKKNNVANKNSTKSASMSAFKNSAKSMEEQTESLANREGMSTNSSITMASPSMPDEDLESIREPSSIKKGGSLYSALAQTAYTLAAPAALLATAALIMRRKTKKHRKQAHKKYKKRHTRKH